MKVGKTEFKKQDWYEHKSNNIITYQIYVKTNTEIKLPKDLNSDPDSFVFELSTKFDDF